MSDFLQAATAFLFIFAAMLAGQRAEAAVNLSPVVPGYSSGSFASAAGSFTMTAANDGFIKPSVINVGGKAITVPATLRMAANAGTVAKTAMRLNPWLLAGSLALPWLIDQGLEWSEPTGQWLKQDTNPLGNYDGAYWYHNTSIYTSCYGSASSCTLEQAVRDLFDYSTQTNVRFTGDCFPNVITGGVVTKMRCPMAYDRISDGYTFNVNKDANRGGVAPTSTPATPSDWDALPDPLPIVGPELPHAPYLPEGVPVDAPSYEFAPYSTPIGDPYTKPDNSTSQPMAKISPNGDSVTVDTYDQPLTDPNGDPVPAPVPQDTPEPSPNHCEQNPNTIGCAQFGDTPAPDELGTYEIPASVTVVPVGGAGSCPADVVTSQFGITWSYQPICDFAAAIKPFILGFAWIAFAYIVAGVVRS